MSTLTTIECQMVNLWQRIPLSIFRIFLLAVLFSAAALFEASRTSALSSRDVWWHLRTGLWIIQNHSFPRSGLFSQYPNLPWIASSWGYEMLLAVGYKWLGLRAIPILLMGLKAALAVLTFQLARAERANFWTAVLLSAVAQYVISNLQPLPSVFSILFFSVELQLILHSRRSGEIRSLFWLPPLFIVWANLHIQFVNGLILLGLLIIALCVEHVLRSWGVSWVSDRVVPLPLGKVGAVAALSLLGTFATPESFHSFALASKTLYSDGAFQYFAEMRSMSFRRPQDYALMLLVMAAFLALGRRRSLELFELFALLAGTVLAFRIQRDAWMAVLPAIAVLGGGFEAEASGTKSTQAAPLRREKSLTAVVVAALFITAALCLPDDRMLMNKIDNEFPVKACDYIVANHLPPPLFNSFSWGGFLTWYMPQYPVAIDGRVELYGDEILDRYFKVTSGVERLDVDPSLARAHTLLLERQSGMAQALTTLPTLSSQYRLLYRDDLAAVFVRQ